MAERFHTGIYCDECGAYPIRGTRFKSTKIYDYDICCDCRYYNYDETCEDFVAYSSPISKIEANKVGPEKVNRIDAQSADEAEEQLREGRNAHVAFFGFFGSNYEMDDYQAVVNFINENKFLTNIHIRLYSFQNHKEAFSTITRGLVHNKSVKHLCWHLIPLHNQGSFLDASPLQDLIEKNDVLEALFITRSKYWPGTSVDESIPVLENEFASKLFQSLQRNQRMKSFRLETVSKLSQATKEQAWEAVKCNRSLMRLHSNFAEPDIHLEMLLSFNQFHWMKRWTNLNATPSKRVQVVREILDTDTKQATSTLYYLFRSFPEAINA